MSDKIVETNPVTAPDTSARDTRSALNAEVETLRKTGLPARIAAALHDADRITTAAIHIDNASSPSRYATTIGHERVYRAESDPLEVQRANFARNIRDIQTERQTGKLLPNNEIDHGVGFARRLDELKVSTGFDPAKINDISLKLAQLQVQNDALGYRHILGSLGNSHERKLELFPAIDPEGYWKDQKIDAKSVWAEILGEGKGTKITQAELLAVAKEIRNPQSLSYLPTGTEELTALLKRSGLQVEAPKGALSARAALAGGAAALTLMMVPSFLKFQAADSIDLKQGS